MTLCRAIFKCENKLKIGREKLMHNFVVHSDESACRKSGCLGLDQVFWVWQYRWPIEIQQALLTEENPIGTMKINDLELSGMVLGWLVPEYVWHDLVFNPVGLFCNKNPY